MLDSECMKLIRTTLRLEGHLKSEAEKIALAENLTLQAIFNRALKLYLEKDARRQAKKIVFKTHNLGVPLNNLRRKDFYAKP